MYEYTIDIISIILLLLGSISMLVIGFGFISSKYIFVVGVVCFITPVFIDRIFKKKT